MVAAPYTVTNSFKGGLLMRTYARNVRRAWDGDSYHAPKRLCLDAAKAYTIADIENHEDNLERAIRETSVAISSSPSRKNSTIFSAESQEGDDDTATTPPSSPPPRISPPAPKARKPTFSSLKRKRDTTTTATAREDAAALDMSEPLGEVINASASRTSQSAAPPAAKKPPNFVQMRLDLGQSDTRKSCAECGMEYVPSNEEDDALHRMYHDMNSDGVELGKAFMKSAMRWVYEVAHIEGSVVVVDRKISPPAKKVVQKVLEVVAKELSAAPIEDVRLWSQRSLMEEKEPERRIEDVKQSESEKRNDHRSDRYKIFLHVKDGKCIAACLAERITKAHRVKPNENQQPEGAAGGAHKSSSISATEETVPAVVGVSRIWTSKAFRRKGIANNLLDCVLNQFIYGMEIDKDELAFSQPTESGGELARAWYGEESGWLVYSEI